MRHSRSLRAVVTTGSLALVAGMLAATAAVPASALAPAADRASACVDGHGDATANARVRKGAKQNEPKPFEGTGQNV